MTANVHGCSKEINVRREDGKYVENMTVGAEAWHRAPYCLMADPDLHLDIYRALDPDRLGRTIERLIHRIDERFQDRGLSAISRRLHEIAIHAKERSEWIARPILWVRVSVAFVIGLIVIAVVWMFLVAGGNVGDLDTFELIQVLEAGINDVVLLGAAIFFLATLETRVKRRRALAAIHELRSVAHIIDMLQLTKDPERILNADMGTASSPKMRMTAFELGRYLDYCAEMLSLAAKVAALYVQEFDDGVAIASVNEVENLTNGLSTKIWHKLMVLHSGTASA